MLQMNKNTKAKAGALAGSALALVSILGLVQRNAPVVTGGATATTAYAATPTAAGSRAPAAASQATPATATATTSGAASVKAQTNAVVNTRTRVS